MCLGRLAGGLACPMVIRAGLPKGGAHEIWLYLRAGKSLTVFRAVPCLFTVKLLVAPKDAGPREFLESSRVQVVPTAVG